MEFSGSVVLFYKSASGLAFWSLMFDIGLALYTSDSLRVYINTIYCFSSLHMTKSVFQYYLKAILVEAYLHVLFLKEFHSLSRSNENGNTL